ncbi:hypothetical protein [Agrobacterium rosae]
MRQAVIVIVPSVNGAKRIGQQPLPTPPVGNEWLYCLGQWFIVQQSLVEAAGNPRRGVTFFFGKFGFNGV